MNVALATTWEQRLADLGNIPADRILTQPPPGTATFEDVVHANESNGRLCELVDGTLVEKAIGWQEALLAGVLLQWLRNFLDQKKLGVVTGADGFTRLFKDTVRGPDVAFVNWNRLPDGRIPTAPIPDLVPNFVIEVLSIGNTYGEMSRKRREYFHAGVELLWLVEPRRRTVTIYRTSNEPEVIEEDGMLDGETVLPGWTVSCQELFSKLDEEGHSNTNSPAR